MPGKKSLTIGITVNLENYENLRLEVTGEVTSQQEVQELVGFLDQTLTTFGRGNPATIALIEKYRARVLSSGDGTGSAPGPATTHPRPEPEWPDMETPAPSQQPLTPPAEAAPVPAEEPAAPTSERTETKAVPSQKSEKPKKQEKQPEPVIQPEPAPVTPAPPQAPPTPAPVAAPVAAPAAPPQAAPSGASCEICGCAVSSSEQKMSQLFMSRTLCKTCMKKA
ncbi:hypothetical protein [Methanosphaerula subterraneus]|uniref:hypothetical protein n=1 Tax=Methanosphaerula subterraneus TaxID=3350244 RepID=UPI003F85F27E